MGFRRIGVLADEVIRRVQETRAAADKGAPDEKEATERSPVELPGCRGGGKRRDGLEETPVTVPGVRNRSGDGWSVKPPRKPIRMSVGNAPERLAPAAPTLSRVGLPAHRSAPSLPSASA